MNKPIFLLLREYRESKGVSQTYIADKIGMPIGSYNHIETGHTRLLADTLVDILEKGLGVTPDIFFRDVLSKNEM